MVYLDVSYVRKFLYMRKLYNKVIKFMESNYEALLFVKSKLLKPRNVAQISW
jgi:hypothetical protein